MPFDLSAREASLGGDRLLGGLRAPPEGNESREEGGSRVNVGVAQLTNKDTIDPAQQHEIALPVDRHDARNDLDAVALHQPQG